MLEQNLARLVARLSQEAVVKDQSFKGMTRWVLGFRLAVCLAVLVFATNLYGQGGGNVAITGTVSDPSGAVIPGAEVKVTQKNTAVTRTQATNANGQFNLPSLPPATYTVA